MISVALSSKRHRCGLFKGRTNPDLSSISAVSRKDLPERSPLKDSIYCVPVVELTEIVAIKRLGDRSLPACQSRTTGSLVDTRESWPAVTIDYAILQATDDSCKDKRRIAI